MPDVKKAGDEHTKLYSLLAYVFGWITGAIVVIIAGNDKTAKFHGIQSIILSVISIVLVIGLGVILVVVTAFFLPAALCLPFVWIGSLVLWVAGIYAGYNAYSEKNMRMKLPVIGNMAEKFVG